MTHCKLRPETNDVLKITSRLDIAQLTFFSTYKYPLIEKCSRLAVALKP